MPLTRSIRHALAGVWVVGASALVPSLSLAQYPAALDLADLTEDQGLRLVGATLGDRFGVSVALAGDVNGDGIDDVIVGAYRFDVPNGISNGGAAYVVFGQSEGLPAELDVDALDGTNGFRILGGAEEGYAGVSVSGAGDVNGDGIDDVIIGAWLADVGADTDAGQAYVVFGQTDPFPANIDIASLDGTQGFVMNGGDADQNAGLSVAGLGDVNGDGFSDVMVGAPAVTDDEDTQGLAYVVFGQATHTSPVDLETLGGSEGLGIGGAAVNDAFGSTVSGIRNFTGEDRIDLLVGAPTDSYFDADFGDAYFLTIESQGVVTLSGANAGEGFGLSVGDAGDVNGDGFGDVIVGALLALNNNLYTGAAYVVFGRSDALPTTIDINDLDGSNGFRLLGEADADLAGSSVRGVGDINGDGLDDIAIGASSADPNGREDSGAVYVVFGRNDGFPASLALSTIDGSNGFKVEGEASEDSLGVSVDAAGDFNDDGFDDLIIGARGPTPDGGSDQISKAYVLFGGDAGLGQTFKASVSANVLDFGAAVSGQTGELQTITITNTGTAPLTLGQATLSGEASSDFVIIEDNCSSQTLALDEQCTVSVRARPTSSGVRSATLTVPSDAGAQTVTLSVEASKPMPVPFMSSIALVLMAGLMGLLAMVGLRRS